MENIHLNTSWPITIKQHCKIKVNKLQVILNHLFSRAYNTGIVADMKLFAGFICELITQSDIRGVYYPWQDHLWLISLEVVYKHLSQWNWFISKASGLLRPFCNLRKTEQKNCCLWILHGQRVEASSSAMH